MKFFTVLATLVAAATAQRVTIFAPTAGTAVSAGQNITVSVVQPVRSAGSLIALFLTRVIGHNRIHSQA